VSAASMTFGIRDWFAWKPGFESRAEWLRRAGIPFSPGENDVWENNTIAPLPMMLRRRINGFGQKVIGAALTIPAVQQARYIFASRHGEFATTLRILEDLHQRSGPSPADFSMSVHHALAGLLSIQTGDKAGHTTVSAGRDTFGYGMLEAAALIADQPAQSALLVSYDEPLPELYKDFQEPDEMHLPLIIALDIVAPNLAANKPGAQLSLTLEPDETGAADERPGEVAALDIPMGQRFLDFFLSDRAQTTLKGETMSWVLRRAA